MIEAEAYLVENWAGLYRLAYLLAGDRDRGDDLLQETALRVLQSWPRVRRAQSRRAYVRRIMVNLLIDAGERPTWSLPGDGDCLAAPGPGLADAQAVNLDLWRSVCALPPRQRAVIVLKYYEDMSERSVAVALGCRLGTVKSQGAAALSRLAREHSKVAIEESPK